ncbi:hypothetical protein RSOLAG22IIIB_01312 [Rhizoctonia solani]|uniref:Uncharacterized protein n=1 Tax=Rhizoctonia solani TaxID=456999 RepID=A0A0K6G5P6_9AGAM|nr:hypothetical protein RSOLAG22IIIB_01312 [Rhizoctonia solani]
MSHPEPTKTSDGPSEACVSGISASGPRNYSSIEYDVRTDIKLIVWNRLSRGMGEEGASVEREETGNGIENDEPPKSASDEIRMLVVDFVRCVSEEKQCTSHRMRVKIKGSFAPGVVIDTPGASVFFWRFWEYVVDLATMTKLHRWAPGDEKTLIASHDWKALVEARKVADARMDKAIELVDVAQRIECQEISGWTIWGKSMEWADLPLLEPLVNDFQFGLFSAISNREDILEPRIQQYICGATLPEPDETKEEGPIQDLIDLRWKWLQLQRFSAKLWNNVGRPEYFPHAIRVLDALACFTPPDTELPPVPEDNVPDDSEGGTKADEPGKNLNEVPGDNSPAAEAVQEDAGATDTEPVIPPLDLSFYYALPEPFEEWSEPPIPRPPTVLQLLLAEGAAIWLSEAMPAILRYQLARPLNLAEKSWFASAQETQQERDERWMKWKRGLAAVFAWCANEHSGMPGKATVLTGVARALRTMTQAEKDARRYLTKGQPSI